MIIDREQLIALRTGKKQAQRSGDYWTKEDQEKLPQLFAEGYGISELAIIFDRNKVAIYQQLSKSGLLSQQCKSRNRRARVYEPQCLCPFCAISDCKNCGKECAHAGGVR